MSLSDQGGMLLKSLYIYGKASVSYRATFTNFHKYELASRPLKSCSAVGIVLISHAPPLGSKIKLIPH